MTRLDPPVTLETERLVLRQPGAADWEGAAAFMTSPRAEFMGGTTDLGEVWAVFAHMVGHWVLRGYGMFVFADRANGRALGMAGPLFPEGWAEPEIGWSLWSGADEGKGYAREAAMAARWHAYADLGWRTAISYIDPRNARSIALARRMGAVEDPAVAHPFGDNPCTVFRHPGPEAAA
jgi:RimJ/RimL family protein N-acetyltransferase